MNLPRCPASRFSLEAPPIAGLVCWERRPFPAINRQGVSTWGGGRIASGRFGSRVALPEFANEDTEVYSEEKGNTAALVDRRCLAADVVMPVKLEYVNARRAPEQIYKELDRITPPIGVRSEAEGFGLVNAGIYSRSPAWSDATPRGPPRTKSFCPSFEMQPSSRRLRFRYIQPWRLPQFVSRGDGRSMRPMAAPTSSAASSARSVLPFQVEKQLAVED
jgi:hypothetical protein